MRYLVVLALWLLPLRAADEPLIRSEPLPSPAAAASFPAVSQADADGTVWLGWLEPVENRIDVRVARLPAEARTWTTPVTVVRGIGRDANARTLALDTGPNGIAAVSWSATSPSPGASASARRAYVSRTTDAGLTWSDPLPLAAATGVPTALALAVLADGRTLVAWVEARDASRPQLFAAVLDASGPARLIDGSVSDSPPALTALPDGSAVLVYRGHAADETRDLRVARYRRDTWDPPHALADERGKEATGPNQGAALARDGGRIAAAWYTASKGEPRVMASLSPDAGARFLVPLQLTETRPAGNVSTVLLHDGAIVVSWVDESGGLWLRRVTPDFTLADPVRLTKPEQGRIQGGPQLALRRDYLGEKTDAEVVVTYGTDRGPGVHAALVTIPEGALLESEKNCDCSGNSADIRGFSLRGKVLAAPADGALRIAHYEVPGIFEAGERTLPLNPEVVLPANAAGREFLGRFERQGGRWVLISVRLIGSAP